MNNLVEIRDIYIPKDVSIFPLAYGWWVILFAIVILFVLLKFILWGIKTSKRLYALKKLKQINNENPIVFAIEVSELLRRICNVKYKEASVLHGNEWINFLNEHTKNNLSKKTSELLMYAPFIDKNEKKYSQKEVLELSNFCKQWIGDNL
ncbi:MAG: DUF4381 domain-containing protein [Alphaproteobacteria bacterium]|nr:DUF4381 domain-containing protein [Alphaproteobacteria bacterium]